MARSKAKVTFSYEGIGEMLRSPFVRAEMVRRADKIKEAAEARSPVGDPKKDPHSGRYKRSWHVSSTDRGGFRHDRASATVYNDSEEAVFVEFGTSRMRGRHVLKGAIDAARD